MVQQEETGQPTYSKREPEREKEHAGSSLRAPVAALHHPHEQVGRVPVHLAIDLLGRRCHNKTDKRDKRACAEEARKGAQDVGSSRLSVAREVRAVRHARRLAAYGAVEGREHDPGCRPFHGCLGSGVEHGSHASGNRQRPYDCVQNSERHKEVTILKGYARIQSMTSPQ